MGNNQSTTSLDEFYLAYGDPEPLRPEPPRPPPRRAPPRLKRLGSFKRPVSCASDITEPLTPSHERYPYPIFDSPPSPIIEQQPSRPITPPISPQFVAPALPQLLLPAPPIRLPAPPIRLPAPPIRLPAPPLQLPAPPPKVSQPPSPVASLTETLCEAMEPLVLGPPPAGPPTPPTPERKPATFMELTSLPSAPWYNPEPQPVAPKVTSPVVRPTSPPILVKGTKRKFSLSTPRRKVSFSDVKVEEVPVISPGEEKAEEDKIGEQFGPATTALTMTEAELEQVGMISPPVQEQKEQDKEKPKVDQSTIGVAVTTETAVKTPPTPPLEAKSVTIEEIIAPAPITTKVTILPEETPRTAPTNDVPPPRTTTPIPEPAQQEKSLPSIQEVDEPIMHLPTSPPLPSRSTTPLSQISFAEFRLPPLTRSATAAAVPITSAPRVSFEAPPLPRSYTYAAPPTSSSLDSFKPVQTGKTFTMRQVSRHSTPNDLWVVVGDEVFDCTEFAAVHPGGAKILNGVAGKDATKKFDKYHPRAVLERYRATLQIGVVDNNNISDGASVISSKSSFSRSSKSFLGKFKFGGGAKKKSEESEGGGVMLGDFGKSRGRRGSM